MEHYISLITKAVFIENILLAYFLGMCSFLAISKKVDASIGLGLAVTFVLTITAPTNWFIYTFLIGDGALAWANLPEINLSFLKPIVFIAVIAAMVQLVEMVIDRFSPALYQNLGISRRKSWISSKKILEFVKEIQGFIQEFIEEKSGISLSKSWNLSKKSTCFGADPEIF